MKRLIDYLREQMILDFQGDLDVAMLHALLEGEDGPIAGEPSTDRPKRACTAKPGHRHLAGAG